MASKSREKPAPPGQPLDFDGIEISIAIIFFQSWPGKDAINSGAQGIRIRGVQKGRRISSLLAFCATHFAPKQSMC
jgi:hypothetical protein